MEWRPLFSGTAESARDLARELGGHGLRAYVEDREGAVLSQGGSREDFSVVLVPPEEAERAAAVAARWHSENARDVARLSGRLRRILLLGSLPAAAWIATSWALGRSVGSELGWLGFAWLLSVILAAQMEHRTAASRRGASPAGGRL